MEKLSFQRLTFFAKNIPIDTAIVCCSTRGIPIETIKLLEDSNINYIQPIIILKGIECDLNKEEYDLQYAKVNLHINSIYGDKKKILRPVLYSDVELWRLMNIRYTKYIMNEFDIYTPCLICRTYYMILNLYIGLLSDRDVVIERKLNERKTEFKNDRLTSLLEPTLNMLEKEFNLKIRKIDYTISNLPVNEWPFVEAPKCIFDSSWRDLNNKKSIDQDKMNRFLNDFVYPISREIINCMKNDETIINYEEIISVILNRIEGN